MVYLINYCIFSLFFGLSSIFFEIRDDCVFSDPRSISLRALLLDPRHSTPNNSIQMGAALPLVFIFLSSPKICFYICIYFPDIFIYIHTYFRLNFPRTFKIFIIVINCCFFFLFCCFF